MDKNCTSAFCKIFYAVYWRDKEVLPMQEYFDIMLTLVCVLAGLGIVVSFTMCLWICVRLDQIREKIEEVLRWL